MMLPTIDTNGFHVGFISESAVNAANSDRVVQNPIPSQELTGGLRWRWVNDSWTQAEDRRGLSWYNPSNTDDVFEAIRFDDTPPAGWILWEPGKNKVAGQQELTNKKWEEVRRARNALLSETDWVAIKSGETGTPVPVAWLEYRQALRDITNQPDPFQIVWPTRPDSAFGVLAQGVL